MLSRYILFLLIAGCSINLIHAQSMKIKMHNGTTVTYNMGEIERITFSNLTGSSEPYETNVPPGSSTSLSNCPNPFNSTTTISYSIPESGKVVILINDLKGQRIRTIPIGIIPSGNHSVEWDGKDDEGQVIAGGMYIYSVNCNGKVQHNKMLLIN
jgi:hypothetical protein